jgi:phosphoribosyl 1,2-cyclic phosphate phosphodiesterase
VKVRAVILGCGSSGGVPRIGGVDGRGNWGDCDPAEPRNRRSRCSVVFQRAHDDGSFEGELTTLLIDTAPELRLQLTDNGIGHVDACAFTHDHADQTHGIDDLRAVAINRRQRVPVYLSAYTSPGLPKRFGYCFERPEGSFYPPILERRDLPEEGEAFTVEGPSGPLPCIPFLQHHGNVPSHGFRVGPIAYSADVNDLYPESWKVVEGTHTWIIDALQYKPHVSHLHLDKSVEFIERAGCKRGVLTNLHVVMDYRTVADATPAHVVPAYDGMVVEA